MKWFGALLALILFALPAKANDVYISQAGGGTGVSCTSPRPVSYFNTASSWTLTAPAAILPGTVVHLCGTFTGAPGTTMLTVQGNGAPSAPITIRFEPNAVLTAPYWGSQGAIHFDGRSYITVDGAGVGVIENTENGTSLLYKQQSLAIHAYKTTGAVVKNLTIENIYVRTQSSDLYLYSAAYTGAIYAPYSNNLTIDHVIAHDMGWAFQGGANNLTITNSQVYNVDHGVAFGAAGTYTGLNISNNYFHDYGAWDSPNNQYHHDGVHIWANGVGNAMTGGKIQNNVFDGDPGLCCTTAHIFIQGSVSGLVVSGNRVHIPVLRSIQAIEFYGNTGATPSVGNTASNNVVTIDNLPNLLRVQGASITVRDQTGFNLGPDNIFVGGIFDVGFSDGSTIGTVDNNVYEDVLTDYGSYNAWSLAGRSYHDLATWQAVCGCDSHSKLIPLKVK
jgi:hypothetical protein